LFLEKLLGYLTETQRLLLDILSIYRNPVSKEAIEVHKVSLARPDRRKLANLSLLECIVLEDKDLYYVHRLTAQYLLQQMKAAVRKRFHKKAAKYFETLRDEEGKIDVMDYVESRWHYLQAGLWNKAAEITFDLSSYLRDRGFTHWAMELLQELELTKLKEENRAEVHHRLGILFGEFFGEYDKALIHYNKALEIKEKIGDIAGAARSMAQMGTLYFQQDKFETALEYFIQAFIVFAKIGSPYANQARNDIARVREKLPEEQFYAILKKFNLTPS
jgi:tetratricopeptide (TPR) repeat protein